MKFKLIRKLTSWMGRFWLIISPFIIIAVAKGTWELTTEGNSGRVQAVGSIVTIMATAVIAFYVSWDDRGRTLMNKGRANLSVLRDFQQLLLQCKEQCEFLIAATEGNRMLTSHAPSYQYIFRLLERHIDELLLKVPYDVSISVVLLLLAKLNEISWTLEKRSNSTAREILFPGEDLAQVFAARDFAGQLLDPLAIRIHQLDDLVG